MIPSRLLREPQIPAHRSFTDIEHGRYLRNCQATLFQHLDHLGFCLGCSGLSACIDTPFLSRGDTGCLLFTPVNLFDFHETQHHGHECAAGRFVEVDLLDNGYNPDAAAA